MNAIYMREFENIAPEEWDENEELILDKMAGWIDIHDETERYYIDYGCYPPMIPEYAADHLKWLDVVDREDDGRDDDRRMQLEKFIHPESNESGKEIPVLQEGHMLLYGCDVDRNQLTKLIFDAERSSYLDRNSVFRVCLDTKAKKLVTEKMNAEDNRASSDSADGTRKCLFVTADRLDWEPFKIWSVEWDTAEKLEFVRDVIGEKEYEGLRLCRNAADMLEMAEVIYEKEIDDAVVMEFIDELVDVLDVDEILDDIVRKSASGRESKS